MDINPPSLDLEHDTGAVCSWRTTSRGRNPHLQQLLKNCSLWERLTLEQLVKGHVLWEGPHAWAGEESEEVGAAETKCYELTLASRSLSPLGGSDLLLTGKYSLKFISGCTGMHTRFGEDTDPTGSSSWHHRSGSPAPLVWLQQLTLHFTHTHTGLTIKLALSPCSAHTV